MIVTGVLVSGFLEGGILEGGIFEGGILGGDALLCRALRSGAAQRCEVDDRAREDQRDGYETCLIAAIRC
ncbi:MAG TPA: hypothetical protein VLW50_02480 [Streptosporangiaceae bacterium]|nr:hypothetical protein [Streptosporangiaceae bacterium]